MNKIIVGIGEYHISGNTTDIIRTIALGSCVAVMIYDCVNKIAGLIHSALPDSSVNQEKNLKLPGYFVDKGLPLLINKIESLGASRFNFRIKLAGGANIMDMENTFNIGKRNILAVKKFLWKNRLGVIREDIGGLISRNVDFHVSTGEILISNGNKQWNL
jgi:chemotaxis protein CheD